MADLNTATPTPAPATIPVAQTNSLSEYREARTKGLTDVPNPAAAPVEPVVVDETPDPEVEANPELRAEIDSIEKPKDNETPAEKRARTIRNKEAARKGYTTRLANKAEREKLGREAAERERDELRRRLETAGTPGGQPTAARPAAAPAVDPSVGPEPSFDTWAQANTFEAFAEKHPNHPDAYAGWQAEFGKEWNRWDRKREAAEAGRASQAEQSDRSFKTALDEFDKHSEPLRRTRPDFDAKVLNLDLTRPMASAIFGSGELGPHIGLYLADHPDEYRRIAALGHSQQLIELGALKATVSATVKPAAAASTTVNVPPEPHTPVGAGASGAVGTPKPSQINSLEEYRANRERVFAGGRS